MKKIAVITDSGSGFTKQSAKEEGIFYLPLQIINEEEMYFDGETIHTDEVYTLLKQGNMPTTSMPLMGVMEDLFMQLKEEGYETAIAITITVGLSGTGSVLQAIAKQFDFPLTFIDCHSTCEIQRYLCRCAKQMVDKNFEVEKIEQCLLDCIRFSNTFIIPNDLEHLKKGGRLTPLAAALGGLLKIKPILQLNKQTEGKIDVFAKVRTMKKAIQNVIDALKEENVSEDEILVALHSDAGELYDFLLEELKKAFPKHTIITGKIGAVISCHTGMECLGIQFIKKANIDEK